MAIEIFSEIFPGISPRISFSHGLINQSTGQDRHHKKIPELVESDFDFSIGNSRLVHQELSSADELFSNGRILPGNQIKKKKSRENEFPNTQKKRLKELLSMDLEDDVQKPAAPPKSVFWRSSSLNCESSTKTKGGLIRSLILFRSNSTGSTPNPKPPLKDSQKQNLQRQSSKKFPNNQRPPLFNKCRSHNNGGVRISPVLNFPPPYISNATASFFGLGSLFCSSKNKKK